MDSIHVTNDNASILTKKNFIKLQNQVKFTNNYGILNIKDNQADRAATEDNKCSVGRLTTNIYG